MKKNKVLLVLISIMLLVGLTSCGKSKETGVFYSENNIFQLLEEANTKENYLNNNERLAYEMTYFYADDTEETIYTYQDAEHYVYEDNYILIVADYEGIYGANYESGRGYRMLFVGEGALEDYVANCPLSWYEYSESEQITAMSSKRGVIFIESVDTEIEYLEDYFENNGYDIAEVKQISYEYEVDEETYEILKLKTSAEMISGDKIAMTELSRVKKCKPFKEDKKLVKSIFEGEQMTLTVMADAGTEDEKVYEQTVSKDSEFNIYILPEYEQVLYADSECKELFSMDILELQEDTALYVQHPKKILIAENAVETDETTMGIDVSRFQGTIDWSEVAKSGIDFAMIRIGYCTDDTGEIKADTNARYNMQEAAANGIKIGVYFFSTAVSEDEALEEAHWVADYISRYPITYPVVYDCENYESSNSRQYALTKSERTDYAITFLNEIYELGYTPMFYSSKSELQDDSKWETSRIEESFKIWVSQYPAAQYPETVSSSYAGIHDMWQYTNDAAIPGIDKPVDMNVAYFGYENVIEAQNPEAPEVAEADVEALMSFKEVDEKVTAKDVTNLRDIPSQGDDSTVLKQLNNGEIAVRTGVSDSGWSRLIIDGQKYYAVSQYLTTNLEYRTPDENGEGGLKTQFTAVSQNVTPKIEVNLRKLPSVTNADAAVVATVYAGEVFERTGINQEYGWSRVEYNGQTLYCVSSYLNIVE